MVKATHRSLLAELEEAAWDAEQESPRHSSVLPEKTSRTRYATSARHNRRSGKLNAHLGPRRRLRKPMGV